MSEKIKFSKKRNKNLISPTQNENILFLPQNNKNVMTFLSRKRKNEISNQLTSKNNNIPFIISDPQNHTNKSSSSSLFKKLLLKSKEAYEKIISEEREQNPNMSVTPTSSKIQYVNDEKNENIFPQKNKNTNLNTTNYPNNPPLKNTHSCKKNLLNSFLNNTPKEVNVGFKQKTLSDYFKK